MQAWHARAVDAERRMGRLLIAITYLSVGLLVIGVVLLLAAGVSPMAGGPALDPAILGAQLARLDPAGFLWLGVLTVIAAPVARVTLAGFGYLREGDRTMAAISVGILAIIAIGVVTASTGTV